MWDFCMVCMSIINRIIFPLAHVPNKRFTVVIIGFLVIGFSVFFDKLIDVGIWAGVCGGRLCTRLVLRLRWQRFCPIFRWFCCSFLVCAISISIRYSSLIPGLIPGYSFIYSFIIRYQIRPFYILRNPEGDQP